MLPFFVMATVFAGAQNDKSVKFGLLPALHYNMHSTNFRLLPGVQDSGAYAPLRSGSGFGYSILANFDFPFSSSSFFAMRAGYSRWDGTPRLQSLLPLVDGKIGTFEHRVEANFSLLSFEALMGTTIQDLLRINWGGEWAVLLHSELKEVEEVLEPSGATLVKTNTPSNTLFEGSLDDASALQFALVAGLQFLKPTISIGPLKAEPELRLSVPLSKIWRDGDWSITSLRLGAVLYFPSDKAADTTRVAPPPREQSPRDRPSVLQRRFVRYDTLNPHRDTVEIPMADIRQSGVVLDTIIYETKTKKVSRSTFHITQPIERYILQVPDVKPLLVASVAAIFVLADDSVTTRAKVTLEEFVMNRHIPLLNYLFFDEKSAQLPARYQQLDRAAVAGFDLGRLYSESTLDIYHHVLNIVGQRMRLYPDAVITITGCTDGTAAEAEAPLLADRRAGAIRDYLRDIWEIDPARIVTKQRSRPAQASNMDRPEGIAENRRVEIACNIAPIFDPLTLSDTLRIVDPPTIRFRTSVASDAGIRSWRLEVMQAGQVLKDIRGMGAVPANIDWDLNNDILRPIADEPLRYRLHLRDSTGQEIATPNDAVIQFEQRTLVRKRRERLGDKLIDSFSLILFDFDSSTLNARNQRVISFIRKRIQPDSRINITGTTDRLGDDEYNRLLSLRRANQTAAALGDFSSQIVGFGEDEFTFDNDLPEGRFYSRTVRVLVETPIRSK